ncbi:MAG: EAL domain-containing protein [Cyanobacteria bacterium]|nr:EAL domain-containing protein [Cyanobacteria bacterium CG_2015-16_32_12]NCO79424.1 EAL domain-containing protein [Cyanobacteria bacterium CG_2015-22_32_23]NCQ05590.1 EAL domain-containing protein [Cyanobacteria bacterium CG_2015-09_32_10]NCQ42318.1 EAL domain-containing protein [Cyanobacteria bacterium CG_2015-04_32_10]NCS85074.1 EAL domain-containing protein [Cyanobacteria bacterium CG_2015-02_32_10]
MMSEKYDFGQKFPNQTLQAGECIFREGETGNFAYIIDEGEVEISTLVNNKYTVLNILKAGDMFGELALVDGSPRSAAAYAKTNVVLTIVTSEQVKTRIEDADPILKLLLMVVMNYFRLETGRLRSAKEESDQISLDNTKKEYQEKIYQAIELIRLESDLRSGFKQNQLVCFYQPIIDLKSNLIVGFEVLLRWFSPTRGNVSPSVFIPLAESTSLIIPIGEWLLEKSLEAILQVKKETNYDIFLSINVAQKQIYDPDFLNIIKEKIKHSSINPKQIKLEILERSLFEGETALSLVKNCRDFGLPLVIDDFGTGYANLSYLKNFKFDTMKIDQCFVKELENNDKDEIICRTLINLSQGLEMTTVAEGIENQQQLDILRSLGCNYGQGYFFSQPLPLDKAIDFMKQY